MSSQSKPIIVLGDSDVSHISETDFSDDSSVFSSTVSENGCSSSSTRPIIVLGDSDVSHISETDYSGDSSVIPSTVSETSWNSSSTRPIIVLGDSDLSHISDTDLSHENLRCSSPVFVSRLGRNRTDDVEVTSVTPNDCLSQGSPELARPRFLHSITRRTQEHDYQQVQLPGVTDSDSSSVPTDSHEDDMGMSIEYPMPDGTVVPEFLRGRNVGIYWHYVSEGRLHDFWKVIYQVE